MLVLMSNLTRQAFKRLLDDMMGEVNIFANDVTLLTNRFC